MPDRALHAQTGTTLAIYMGACQIGTIVGQLLAAGAGLAVRAQVGFAVAKPTGLLIESPLADRVARIAATGRKRAALILITLPKTHLMPARTRFEAALHADH